MLEHVFAPFLECCGDAVMFAKRNVAHDDEDDVTVMAVVFLLISGGGCEEEEGGTSTAAKYKPKYTSTK